MLAAEIASDRADGTGLRAREKWVRYTLECALESSHTASALGTLLLEAWGFCLMGCPGPAV
jgi:hypothetical protein